MDRRAFLATTALALAGCTGPDNSSSSNGDGYAPEFETTPEAPSVDPSSFDTKREDGVDVPLVPIDVAYPWYMRQEARVVDARGETSYQKARVDGAVLSPAPDGGSNDPVAGWSTDDRIVCYCGCPHHLSVMRAATLLQNGYENVYALDEGFGEWHERSYPMAGSSVGNQPNLQVVRGRTSSAFAGETAWVRHESSGQREPSTIGDDGTYVVEFRFFDLEPDSILTVETPEYTVTKPLEEATASVVTAESS